MKTIQQTVTFGVPPEKLFDIYLDAKKHAAAVNSQASISRKVGGRFRIFGGALQGKNLAVVPKRMIVQTWRGSNWKKSEGDSILILTFTKTRGGGRINLVHVLPDRHYAGCNRGWKKYYWKPWRAYLRRAGR
ncbi:MAG: SRPBCC domain-containing protein [candidate division NC10 bacterium]